MSDRLPTLTPRKVINALERGRFEVRRVRGSHYQLVHPDNGRRVTVPHHTRDLKRSTLKAIIDQAGLTAAEFIELL